MKRRITKPVLVLMSLGVLVACGDDALLPAKQLFGATMARAFALGSSDVPLTSEEIRTLSSELPLSLTTDPIDL